MSHLPETAIPGSFSARFSEGEWDRPLPGSLTLWPIIEDEWDGLVELIVLETSKIQCFQKNACHILLDS
jgi:hypothetical protein